MRLLPALLLLLIALPARAQWPAVDSSRAHQRAAVEAYRAGDDAALLRHMQAALALRPHHPTLLYSTALAHAKLGQREPALAALGRYAGWGLTARPAASDDFAALHDDPDFQALAARLAANAEPSGRADTLWTGLDAGFFPEGVALDARTGDLYLTSVAHGQVVRIRDGVAQPFFDARAHALWSMTGATVDAARERLWACTAAIQPGLAGADSTTAGRSALLALDLATGVLLERHDLASADAHLCGDLALTPDGTVWLTDSAGGGVYRLPPGADAIETALAPGSLPSPQGLAPAPDGTLYVADYALGIVRVDPAAGTTERMPYPDGTLLGVDGLYLHEGMLIAVQNGVRPQRVVRIPVLADGLGVPEVVASALPGGGEPTLGVVDRDALILVANSAWPHLGRDGVVDTATARPPLLVRVPLR